VDLGESIPEVRHEIDTEHLGEASVVRPRDDGRKPENNSNVGKDNLIELVRCEHDGSGFEVCENHQPTC